MFGGLWRYKLAAVRAWLKHKPKPRHFKRVHAYVVFQNTASWRPWNIFTSAGWRHCWVMTTVYWPAPGLTADRYMTMVEGVVWGLHVDTVWTDPIKLTEDLYREGATAVLQVSMPLPPAYVHTPAVRLMTCVTVVKAVLGLRACWVWTPKQLFTYLVRHHGATLMPWPVDHQQKGEGTQGDG